MTFKNEILGGTVLIRPAIVSPNFVHNTSGWAINKDGTAEFQNATVRGTLIVDSIDLNASIHSDNYVPGISGWSINQDGTAEFQDVVSRGDFFIHELTVVHDALQSSIQSPDYTAGVDGWTINPDGSAEFQDATIRGDLHASSLALDGNALVSSIQSPGFTHLIDGWSINPDGTAEFQDVTIRGSVHMTELIAETDALQSSIQSPDYTPGTDGWSINPDGTAEFQDATIRGTIIVDTLTINDTAANGIQYLFEDQGGGLVTLVSGTSDVASTFRNSYGETPTNHHKREYILALDDLPNSYGTDIGRKAYIAIRNRKIEGSASTVDTDNIAEVILASQIDSDGTPGLAYLLLRSNNSKNYLTLSNAGLWLTDYPHRTSDCSENSFYAAGCHGQWFNVDFNINLSTTNNTYTTLAGLTSNVCKAGRLYLVRFMGGDDMVTGGSGFAATDGWRFKLQRDDGGGYDDINSQKYVRGVAAASRYQIPEFCGLYSPSSDKTVAFRCQAAKVSGSTSITSTVEAAASTQMLIVVQDIGWSVALND